MWGCFPVTRGTKEQPGCEAEEAGSCGLTEAAQQVQRVATCGGLEGELMETVGGQPHLQATLEAAYC